LLKFIISHSLAAIDRVESMKYQSEESEEKKAEADDVNRKNTNSGKTTTTTTIANKSGNLFGN